MAILISIKIKVFVITSAFIIIVMVTTMNA